MAGWKFSKWTPPVIFATAANENPSTTGRYGLSWAGGTTGVAVVDDEYGRLGVFAVDRDTGFVVYNVQKEPNSPAWSNWITLVGPTVMAPLAAGQDTDGRLELFTVDAHAFSVKHIFQDDDRKG